MVKMINALFGSEMWVSEDRVDEYLTAGHQLAVRKPVAEPKKKQPKKAKKK